MAVPTTAEALMKNIIFTFTFLLLYINICCADYFGRNKVQYETFQFKVLKTKSFDIHFYNSERKAVDDAAKMLERWHNRFKLIFDQPLPKNQPILIYTDKADFLQTNAVNELLSQEIGGVTEGFMNRVVVPLTGIYSENDHVLGHELVHVFHYNIMKNSFSGVSGGDQIPLWFIEGMSEYLSIGTLSPLTSMWMRDAVLSGNLPSIELIGKDMSYFPYRFGHAIWAYITGRFGDKIICPLFEAVLESGWQQGFTTVLGVTIDSLSLQWHTELKESYAELINDSTESYTGKNLFESSDITLSPTLSPDGSLIAFFSSKDLFSIDLFIAETKNGKILSKLANTQTDEHFESLRFINSAGCWSPDGQKIAVTVFKDGNNAITISDVKSGKIRQTLKFDSIGEIYQVAWSPDGQKILISGTSNAICDLFIYDFSNNKMKRLTNDRFAELQPSWAPDGQSFLFVTDRDNLTNFDSLVFSNPKIGIYDMNSDSITIISIADWAKHTDPQFSPDGSEIFFISDPDGICNIYSYSLQSLRFFKITNTVTGISGLTELSPALSIASKNGKFAFSIFENSSYKINIMEPQSIVRQEFSTSKSDYIKTVQLPPLNHKEPIVDLYLANPNEGLVSDSSFQALKYNPRLRLLYVGNLFAGLSADPLGVGIAGGVSFLFSDLLGNHMLGLGAQLNGGIRDFGAEGFYLNQERRPNWGIVLSRIPYMATGTTVERDTATVNGQSTNVQKITITDQRMYDNQMNLILQFPLTVNRRLEFSAGFGRISYDFESEEIKVLNNRIINRQTGIESEPSSLNLYQSSAAFVGDFSFFGFTGPVTGRRFRLEYQQTTGSLLFGTVLADYRQYFLFNPVTLAFRFFHLGRYLRDSQDERLSELFIGNETWIRGYSYYSFDLTECSESGDGEDCPEYNRLLGSRIGVFNVELRLPILGTEQFGLVNFPYLPTDLVAFFDGGVAWTSRSHPQPELNSKTSKRVPVYSVGGATRMSLFGLLVLQIYAAYPFQRNDTRWSWGFFLAPAW